MKDVPLVHSRDAGAGKSALSVDDMFFSLFLYHTHTHTHTRSHPLFTKYSASHLSIQTIRIHTDTTCANRNTLSCLSSLLHLATVISSSSAPSLPFIMTCSRNTTLLSSPHIHSTPTHVSHTHISHTLHSPHTFSAPSPRTVQALRTPRPPPGDRPLRRLVSLSLLSDFE